MKGHQTLIKQEQAKYYTKNRPGFANIRRFVFHMYKITCQNGEYIEKCTLKAI